MNKLNNILLSEILTYNVRCDLGLEHGQGVMIWMYPPVHRVLGWITRPSTLKLTREVWRLNQFRGFVQNNIYVKGSPAISEEVTLQRFPTLINAHLLNKNGEKIANIVDLLFELKTGKILYYLVSRSNPKIPGTSRWSLSIDQIEDQQPGMILTNLMSLDELPLKKASIREEFLRKSKDWKIQIQDITDRASNKLEGWLEESPWEEQSLNYDLDKPKEKLNFSDEWIDDFSDQDSDKLNELEYSRNYYKKTEEGDPWI